MSFCKIKRSFNALAATAALAGAALAMASPAGAQDFAGTDSNKATYADLVEFSEKTDLVLRAEIRRQTRVKAERAPGLKPGFARLYIEANTLSLIAGSVPVGEALTYLVDVPLNAKGKPPKLKGAQVLLMANTVPARPGTLQLVNPDAQFAYTPALEQRLRPILTELLAANPPPKVTGVGDALAVEGTLVGESETQIFLTTEDDSPVSITVLRRPGQAPAWGVSWGEIIDSSARPIQPRTLKWYRLACSMPDSLPSSANLARDPSARRLAVTDYEFVVSQLGPCERNLTKD